FARRSLNIQKRGMKIEKGIPDRAAVLHAELFHFFVVVLAVEDVPFLAAFKNGAFLAFNFLPRSFVDSLFLIQKVLKNFADFEANGISVFDKIYFIHGGERVGHHMRNLVSFIAVDPHSTALYLRTSSFFTLRNIS